MEAALEFVRIIVEYFGLEGYDLEVRNRVFTRSNFHRTQLCLLHLYLTCIHCN